MPCLDPRKADALFRIWRICSNTEQPQDMHIHVVKHAGVQGVTRGVTGFFPDSIWQTQRWHPSGKPSQRTPPHKQALLRAPKNRRQQRGSQRCQRLRPVAGCCSIPTCCCPSELWCSCGLSNGLLMPGHHDLRHCQALVAKTGAHAASSWISHDHLHALQDVRQARGPVQDCRL